MTWLLLLAWINDPTRTVQELQGACSGLGLAPTGNTNQLLTKLRAHIASQPDLNDMAAWSPATPTPTPLPTPPAHADDDDNNQSWLLPLLGIAAVIALLVGLFVWAPWNNDNSSNDASVTTTILTPVTTPDTTEVVDIGTPPLPPSTVAITSTGWNINKIDVANDPIVDAWLNQLRDPAPQLWQTFPNIANPLVPEFNVANGMEYGVANVPFCQQDMRCDFIVPAQHYRLITADYSFQGMTCISGDTGKGCMLLLINVGDTSYTWRNQMSDNGFTVSGRYFNGDALDMGVWGLVSHASANMLNMPTVSHPGETLNDGVMTNGGANCGVPQGCNSVEVTIVVHAGDRILAVATTTVTR